MNIDAALSKNSKKSIPIELVTEQDYPAYLKAQKKTAKATLEASQFKAKPYTFSIIYRAEGTIAKVVVGTRNHGDIWAIGNLPYLLPEADYAVQDDGRQYKDVMLELGWILGAYQFDRYKKTARKPARIQIRSNQNSKHIHNLAETIYWIRDIVNTPTEDMTPAILAAEAKKLAQKFHAKYSVIVGDNLLKQNFPTVHFVGRAAKEKDNQPRFVELTWGNPKHKKLTLVGKGVCFDTGGLDLKTASGMLLMKKDMAGAAHALGLAKIIMQEKLPIHLQVLVPAVENAVSDNAMRPGDIVKTRKGLTVEIGNTDAEGRLILADALAYASEARNKPNLMFDFATLTGAHHVALGPAIPAILTKHTQLRNDLQRVSEACNDLVWPLPMYQDYRPYMDSPIADLNNSSRSPYAGCITAGLFLAEFVDKNIPWAHFDMMAYNPETLPGRPMGADAQALRAIFTYLKNEWI